MMKSYLSILFALAILLILSPTITAQNVGIGTTTPRWGRLMIEHTAVPISFRETGVAVQSGGLWRMPLDGGILRFDVNTGTAGNEFVNGNLISGVIAMTPSGNVGLSTLAPIRKLDVNGDAQFRGNDIFGGTGNFRVNGGTGGYVELKTQSPDYGVIIRDGSGTGYFGNIEVENNRLAIGYRVSGGQLFIETGGNVGIGIANPTAKLEVNGSIKWGTAGASLGTGQGANMEMRGTGTPYIDFSNDATVDYDARLILNNNNRLTLDGAEFNVLNTISAKRVKVTATGYPDYVFYDDYDLKTLPQVEKFIHKKGHLPGVPSEKEIVEKGLDLNDQSMWQQEKIEELFLHMIEMDKRMKQMTKKVAELEKENAELKKNKH